MENRRAPKRPSVASSSDSPLTSKKGKPDGESSATNELPSVIAPIPERRAEMTERAPEGNLNAEVPPGSSSVKGLTTTASKSSTEIPSTAVNTSSISGPTVAKTENMTGEAPGGSLNYEAPPESNPVKDSASTISSKEVQDVDMASVKSSEDSIDSSKSMEATQSASTVSISSGENEVLGFNPELHQVWRSPTSSGFQVNARKSSASGISTEPPSDLQAGACRSLSSDLFNEFDNLMAASSEENVEEDEKNPADEKTADKGKTEPPKKKYQQ